MPSPAELYEQLLARTGSSGEAFNATEYARAGQKVPGLESLSLEELTQLNRYAQSADSPATALLAAPYEGLKGLEQQTGIPALSGPGRLMQKMGVPVALPNKTTSPASMGNVKASMSGALRALLQGFARGQR